MEEQPTFRVEPTYQPGKWPRRFGLVWGPHFSVGLTALVYVLLAIGMAGVPAYFWTLWLGWLLDGEIVQGDITRSSTDIEYVYTVDEQHYTGRDDLNVSASGSGPIYVLYWRSFPAASRLVDGPTGPVYVLPAMWVATTIGLFGLMFVVGIVNQAIALFDPRLRYRILLHLNRKRQLYQTLRAGRYQVLQGDIVKATVHELTGEDAGTYRVSVQYRFQSPTSADLIEGTYMRDQLRKPDLSIPPDEGDRLGAATIVYISDDQHFLI